MSTAEHASDTDSIEALRARYAALMAAGQDAVAVPPLTVAPAAIPPGALRLRETVPGGWYTTVRLARGEALRIIDASGASAVSTVAWNADDTSERYNSADTVKIQWTADIRVGRVLLTDMGRVCAALVEDSCGAHDTLIGGSTPESVTARYGAAARARNARDNLILAAGKHGLDRRDIPPAITFFAPVRTDAEGRFRWRAGLVKPGDFVTLRAAMNLLVALSNTRHPLDPADDPVPGPIEIAVFRAPPPAADDACRTLTAEARRAYENTDPLFA
jgi:urea carboxylase-associated protein 2